MTSNKLKMMFLLKPSLAVEHSLNCAVTLHFKVQTKATYCTVRHNVIVARQLNVISAQIANEVLDLCGQVLGLEKSNVLHHKKGAGVEV